MSSCEPLHYTMCEVRPALAGRGEMSADTSDLQKAGCRLLLLATINLVMQHRACFQIGEELAAFEEIEFNEEGEGSEVATELIDQVDRGFGGAAGGEEVIDQDDVFSGMDGVLMDFEHGVAIFEGVGFSNRLPGEFTGFSHRDEPDSQTVGDGGAEDEPAGVDTDDFGRAVRGDDGGEGVDGEFEEFATSEDGGDVFENDSGFREVGDIANGFAEFGGKSVVVFVHRKNLCRGWDGLQS